MANIELDGANKKIKVDSGDLTLDVPGDIILDADGGDVVVADGGTNILKVTNSSSDVVFQPQVDAKDIIFKQYDGTTVATVEDNGTFNIPANKLAIDGTAVTSTAAELNILDGVTATAAEINLIDGGTARGTTAIADGDGVLINDAGTMRMTNVTTLKTYIGGFSVSDITGATELAETPATTDEFVISDAGTLKRLDAVHIFNQPYFSVYRNGTQNLNNNSHAVIQFNAETFDSDSKYNTSTFRFTPTIAGYYFLHAQMRLGVQANGNISVVIRKNGAAIARSLNDNSDNNSVSASILIESDDNDFFDVEGYQNTGSARDITGAAENTFFVGFKVA